MMPREDLPEPGLEDLYFTTPIKLALGLFAAGMIAIAFMIFGPLPGRYNERDVPMTAPRTDAVTEKTIRLLTDHPENWSYDGLDLTDANSKVRIFISSDLDKCKPGDLVLHISQVEMPGYQLSNHPSDDQLALYAAIQGWREQTRDGRKFHEEVMQRKAASEFLNAPD